MTTPTGVYPVDYEGTRPSNKVTGEFFRLRPTTWREYYFYIPRWAPFFEGTLTVTLMGNGGRELVLGKDYVQSHLFIEASRAIGRNVYGSITFFDKELQGVIQLSYQTLGGEWTLTTDRIEELLIDRLTNPRRTSWEQIADTPRTFPVVDHEWHLDDMVGMKEIQQGLAEIRDVMMSKNEDINNTHVINYNNPHKVTKEQVGLSNVPNYAKAELTQAEDGVSDNTLMTPYLTKMAIRALSIPIDHLENYNNPHQVTKEQVGLRLVENLPLANNEQAIDGSLDNLYMTPQSTHVAAQHLIDADLGSHEQDYANPHRVTAEQVGTYNKATIDSKINAIGGGSGSGGGNADTFGGRNPGEWENLFLSKDEMEYNLSSQLGGVDQGLDNLQAVNIPSTTIPADTVNTIIALHPGETGYIVLYNDNSVRVYQQGHDLVTHTDIAKASYGYQGYYLLSTEGALTTHGEHPYPIPSNLENNIFQGVVAGRYQVIATDYVGGLVRWGDPEYDTSQAIPSDLPDIESIVVNQTGLAIGKTFENVLIGWGNSSFGRALENLDTNTDVLAFAMDNKRLVMTNNSGETHAYTVTWSNSSGNTITLTPETIPESWQDVEIVTLSGWSTHIVGRTSMANVVTWGEDDYGQCTLPLNMGTIRMVVAGHQFSVAVDANNTLWFWGRTDDNTLLPQ